MVMSQTEEPQSSSPRTPDPSNDNTEIYQWVVGIVCILIAFTLVTIIGLLFRLFFHYVQERRLKRFGYIRTKLKRRKRRDRSHRAYVVASKRLSPVPTLSQRVHVDEYGQPMVDDYGYIPPPPFHPPPAPPINYHSGVVQSSRVFVPILESEPPSEGLLIGSPQPYIEQQVPHQLTNHEQDSHVTRPSRFQHGPSHPPTIPEEDGSHQNMTQDALPGQQEHPPPKQDDDLSPEYDQGPTTGSASAEDYGGWQRSAPEDFVFGRRSSSRRLGPRSQSHHSGNRRDREDRDLLYQSVPPSVVDQAVVRNPMFSREHDDRV
ncbi:uncharacterized protein LOC129273449 [Lytechinus pictus]|uniref:uncharacterized protein LOC129273449 n=1 Tax=Lytechinus pictus TaxID=7653 RepID=UPI0030B9FDEF